jgi:hypothetical protein
VHDAASLPFLYVHLQQLGTTSRYILQAGQAALKYDSIMTTAVNLSVHTMFWVAFVVAPLALHAAAASSPGAWDLPVTCVPQHTRTVG